MAFLEAFSESLGLWLLPLMFVLGAALGSFGSMLSYRLSVIFGLCESSRPLSLLRPASFCPHCQRPLRLYDNLPLVSYLMLKGRCRFCRAPIGAMYFLNELGLGVLFAFVAYRFGLSEKALSLMVFLVLAVPLFWLDIRYLILPDELTLLLVFVVYALAAYLRPCALPGMVTGSLFLSGTLFFCAFITRLWLRRQTLGLGDLKLSFALGALVSPERGFFVLLSASVFGLVYHLFKTRGRRFSERRAVPIAFGPFLMLGTLAVALYEGPGGLCVF